SDDGRAGGPRVPDRRATCPIRWVGVARERGQRAARGCRLPRARLASARVLGPPFLRALPLAPSAGALVSSPRARPPRPALLCRQPADGGAILAAARTACAPLRKRRTATARARAGRRAPAQRLSRVAQGEAGQAPPRVAVREAQRAQCSGAGRAAFTNATLASGWPPP